MLRSAIFKPLNESTERIRVYRLAANPILDNRNAGSLTAVISHMYSAHYFGWTLGNKIFVYDVTVTLPYSEYVAAKDGSPRGGEPVKTDMVGRTDPNIYIDQAYFFPAGSNKWQATLVKQMDLAELVRKVDELCAKRGDSFRWRSDLENYNKRARLAKEVLGT